MTKGERAFADALLTIGIAALVASTIAIAIIGVASLAGVTLTYLRRSLSWEQAWTLLITPITERGPLVAVGFTIFLLAALAWDNIKAGHWRRVLMPAFIWPESSSETPSLVARLGRVLHWIFVVFAALALAIGAYTVYESYSDIAAQKVAQTEWDKTHPVPGKPGFVITRVPDEYGGHDYRPEPGKPDHAGLLLGFCCSFVLLLVGRAFRYILSGE
jgi:hypothetical protein